MHTQIETNRFLSLPRLASGLLAGALLSAPLAAQTPTQTGGQLDTAEVTQRAMTAHSLQRVEGKPLALGRGFRADFQESRVDFLPALGEKAERDLPLSFELEGIYLGDQRIHTAEANVAADIDGDFVRYQRGADVIEQYEITANAILQSFLFEDLPAGGGDLVVRGRLHTDLGVPTLEEDGSLLFEQPGLGGVSYGAVTGIDAHGATVAGSLRSDGKSIELVLPGDFVANAALPLLLDPVIAPRVTIDDSVANDINPDLCTAAGSYFVVWERVYSANHHAILMQRISGAGGLLGGPVPIFGSSINMDPTIGYVSATHSLLIAWTFAQAELPTVTYATMMSYSLMSEDKSNAYFVNTVPYQRNIRIGGDQSDTDDEAFLVWEEPSGIRGVIVNVPNGGVPTLAGPVFNVDDSTGTFQCIHPDISESVSQDGLFLLVWERLSNSGNGQIYGQIYTRNGVDVGTQQSISADFIGSTSSHKPSCDGNGKTFLVAYERNESIASPFTDIACKSITAHGYGFDVPGFPTILSTNEGDSEYTPCVSVTGTNAVVAWFEERWWWSNGIYFSAYSAFATGVDLYTGKPYGEVAVLHDGALMNDLAVASQAAGDLTLQGRAMFAWSEMSYGAGESDIVAERYQAPSEQTLIGLGCGNSGALHVQNAVAGNSDFAIHLRDSAPDALAVLVIGGTVESVGCGPCTLFPKLEAVYYATTNASGDAKVNIPIGAELAGVTFYSQWAVFAPGGACTLVDLNLTRSIATQIGAQP